MGTWQRARDGVAVLDDVDADAFVRFCEFAYTGGLDEIFCPKEARRWKGSDDHSLCYSRKISGQNVIELC